MLYILSDTEKVVAENISDGPKNTTDLTKGNRI